MAESITEADINAFLKDKKAEIDCPSCHQNTWSAIAQNWTVMVPIQESADYKIPPPHVPAFAMICNNCGFIKFFARRVIEIWKSNWLWVMLI